MSDSKIPGKVYEKFVLEALVELGGSAPIRSVMQRVESLLGDRLSTVDRATLTTGGTRWEKGVNFAKMRLQSAQLVRSDREKWFITPHGRECFRTGKRPEIPMVDRSESVLYFQQHRDELVTAVTRWFEKEHGKNSIDKATVEASLQEVFRR